MWRNFPMIRSKRWVKDNMVLLGDAKATAHFSIGSGTKLAMEDAIALADAMQRAPTVEAALQQYEEGRREEVEKTQHAADVSLVWFEHVDRFWDFDPVQFAFGVMTRAKAITYDNLTLRAPDFVAEVDKAFARQVRAKGFDVDVEKPVAPMFQPLRLREMELANRAVVSPMCMYSAQGRRARRFPSGALRLARDRRRRPDLHRDDLRRPRRPHHAGLRRTVERRAGSGLAAHRRFRPCQFGGEDLPAARPRRPQGRHQADVGRHGPSAGAGRLGRHVGVANSLLSRQPGAARDGPRRDGCGQGGVRRRRPSAASAAASTCWSCIAPTAICSRVSSRR